VALEVQEIDDMKKVPIAGVEITLNDDPYLNLATSIFCAGCNLHCTNCQNADLRSPDRGILMSIDSIVDILLRREDLSTTFVFVGGEWMLYAKQYRKITKKLFKKCETTPTVILYAGDTIS